MRAECPLKNQTTTTKKAPPPSLPNKTPLTRKTICFFGTPSNTKNNKNAGTYTLIFHPQEKRKGYH